METDRTKKLKKKLVLNENKRSDQTDANLPDTENSGNKNIFIEMESSSNTSLLVAEPLPKQNQQVDSAQIDMPIPQTASQEGPIQTTLSSASDTEEIVNLPDTVTKLTTANGSEVFLIGTAHFSPKSVQDVQNIIRAIKPSVVILELCQERAFMLSLDEAALLEQNKTLSFAKIKSAIAEKGLAQGLIFIMFIKMSVSITEKLGLAPGAEFRAGYNEALKIPRCSVILGDRSLKLTVARAVASVSTWQKIKLIYQVLANDISITQEDVEKCKEKDILEQMLHELGGEFPGFKRVLLDERNIYLAHSIYQWAQRSETSLGPQRAVAIVGIGHVNGIIENWGKTTDDDIRLVSELPKTSKTRRIVTKTIKYCSVAMLFYVCYRTCVPTSIQTVIYNKITER